jgi:hypothetical protein
MAALFTIVGNTRFPVGSKVPGCGGELREREEVCSHPFDGFAAPRMGAWCLVTEAHGATAMAAEEEARAFSVRAEMKPGCAHE